MQNGETSWDKINSQLCLCCRTGSKSVYDCAWTVNLPGEKTFLCIISTFES